MRFRAALLTALAVVATLFVAPGHAAGYKGFVSESAYVHTKHGDIHVSYWRPAKGKAPVILQMTPYRYIYTQLPNAATTDAYSDMFVPDGYAAAFADVLGTGQSGGCWNYGGKAEAEAGAAVVEWLGTRPWSNGKVGMIGTSYDGAIQAEIATLAPKHLAAIVPQEPVTSWYEYNYDHAVTHNSNDDTSADQTGYPVGTPDLFDFVLNRTPDPSRPQSAVKGECGAVEHNLRGHYAQPEYTSFWRERDWALRAGKVKAAVLFQHGWRDMNTKPNNFTRFWQRLTHAADRRAILGQWEHADIFTGSGAKAFPVDPREYLHLFFDRWLKGKRSKDYDAIPKVLSAGSDKRVRSTLPLAVRQTRWHLSHPSAAVGTIGSGRRGESQASFVNSGTETSKVYKSDPTTQIGFTAFRSTPLKSARRLVGSGTLAFVGTCSLPRGQLAVTLFDTAKDGTTKVITLGLLDLRFRRSLASAEAVPTGEFTAVVTLRPQDYVVAAGHRIVLTVAGSDSVWGVPDPVAGQQITVSGDSVLSLPLVGAGAVVE